VLSAALRLVDCREYLPLESKCFLAENSGVIAKEPDKKSSHDRFLAAGLEAERQMHFYLNRAFGHEDEVMVFGDLRFPAEKDACQIDHLVMHRWGLVIIESKSVSGEIEVNEHEEWMRRFGGHAQGMSSPILQAGRQRDFLLTLLQQHRGQLRRKVLGVRQGGFTHCPVDLFVAISDHGRIKRRGADPPELKKADQIPHEIEAIIERHRKGSSLLRGSTFSDDGMWDMNLEEMARVRDFLLERHQPRFGTGVAGTERPPALVWSEGLGDARETNMPNPQDDGRPPAVATPRSAGPAPAVACRHCASTDASMLHGRGPRPYYLRCAQCGKSTSLEWVCQSCGGEARIRKSRLEFTRWCKDPTCGFEELIFTNSAEA